MWWDEDIITVKIPHKWNARDLDQSFQLLLKRICVLLNLESKNVEIVIPLTREFLVETQKPISSCPLTQTESSMKMSLQLQISIKAFPMCSRQQCTNNGSNHWENKGCCYEKQRLLQREEAKHYLCISFLITQRNATKEMTHWCIWNSKPASDEEHIHVPVALSAF